VAKDVMVSQEMAEKFKTEKDTPYLRFVRTEGLDIIRCPICSDLRTSTQALAAPRARASMSTTKPRAPPTTAMLRDRARQEAGAVPPFVRGNDSDPERPRLDHDLEQAGQRSPSNGRRAHFRRSAQLLVPALQWSGQEAVRFVAVTTALGPQPL